VRVSPGISSLNLSTSLRGDPKRGFVHEGMNRHDGDLNVCSGNMARGSQEILVIREEVLSIG
jgi:hypothetical protein